MVGIWGESKARRGKKQCQDGVEVAVSSRVGREAPTEMMGQGGGEDTFKGRGVPGLLKKQQCGSGAQAKRSGVGKVRGHRGGCSWRA